MNNLPRISLFLCVVFLIQSCSKPTRSELTFEEVSAVQNDSGDVKIIGFAKNDSNAFITMAVLGASYVLDNGEIYIPHSRFVIDVYAAPGQKFPFHTGWEKVPHPVSTPKITLYSTDPVRNPKFWEQQNRMRQDVQLRNVVPNKTGAYLGFTGDVFSRLDQLLSVHAIFACYDSNGNLQDVDSFTVKAAKDMAQRLDGYSFATASSGTDRSPTPKTVVAYVQHLETALMKRPDSVAPEPSIQ